MKNIEIAVRGERPYLRANRKEGTGEIIDRLL
jgi:hypothetical protein